MLRWEFGLVYSKLYAEEDQPAKMSIKNEIKNVQRVNKKTHAENYKR